MKLSLLLLTLTLLTFLYRLGAVSNDDGSKGLHCDPSATCASTSPVQSNLENDLNEKGEHLKINESNYHFRAAIYEHDRIDLLSASASVEANLNAYDKAANTASENGAQIIVFPEDGLYDMPTRLLGDVLEFVPDPKTLDKHQNNPCKTPEAYEKTMILLRLSCMARQNNMYVVANYGTSEKCEPGSRVKTQVCPDKGRFDMNTNVVLGPNGTYLARYRKWNLFIEAFDRATDVESIFFDTPLGRFGIFTCFDMLFKRPAMDLVEEHKIDTLLFPTWWYDELPSLTALAVQDGWSWANKVNLLAANVKKPEQGSVGSGIYSTNDDFVHTSTSDKKPQLLIANIPKHQRLLASGHKFDIDFAPISIDMEANNPPKSYKHLNFKLRQSDTLATLNKIADTRTVCNNEICCTVDYEISQDGFNPEKLARLKLVARDSLRNSTFKWYEQVCFVAEMENSQIDWENSKGIFFAESPSFKFYKLELNGTFNTNHVFPVALHNVNKLIQRTDRKFECRDALLGFPENTMYECEHLYRPRVSKPEAIVSFGMYGRVFERDQINFQKKELKRWPDDK